jgi:hypothetical protein
LLSDTDRSPLHEGYPEWDDDQYFAGDYQQWKQAEPAIPESMILQKLKKEFFSIQ